MHKRKTVTQVVCVATCPRCGTLAGDHAICSSCDFILDTSSLGGDILDDLAHLRLRRVHQTGEWERETAPFRPSTLASEITPRRMMST
jgi:hypothetical protein